MKENKDNQMNVNTVNQICTIGPKITQCNSRLLRSHMRLKKNRPYNHWLKSQGHYLLCFSTSRTVGANSVRLRHETRTRYSLKATTKISPHSRK